MLYALDLGPDTAPDERRAAADRALASTAEHFELPPGARAFAEELVAGVIEHVESLDVLLARHATHWRVERMAAVDRNVLRLAAYEIVEGGTPAAVAIDEAVDLARRFGGERSPAFVNGVLDALARASGEQQP